jgi:hypothetical protein
MKYGDFTLGHIEAILNKIGGEEGARKLLAGEVEIVPVGKKVVEKTSFLVCDGSFSAVNLTARHYPQKYYRTGSGLYVGQDFVDRILKAAEPTEVGRRFKKTSYRKLEQNASGKKIKLERSKDIWTATDFCAWLSAKLAKQSNGEDGELLNTGWANLFLVEGFNRAVFVVSVGWYSVDREWVVDAWLLDGEWRAGSRFVSKPIVL